MLGQKLCIKSQSEQQDITVSSETPWDSLLLLSTLLHQCSTPVYSTNIGNKINKKGKMYFLTITFCFIT